MSSSFISLFSLLTCRGKPVVFTLFYLQIWMLLVCTYLDSFLECFSDPLFWAGRKVIIIGNRVSHGHCIEEWLRGVNKKAVVLYLQSLGFSCLVERLESYLFNSWEFSFYFQQLSTQVTLFVLKLYRKYYYVGKISLYVQKMTGHVEVCRHYISPFLFFPVSDLHMLYMCMCVCVIVCICVSMCLCVTCSAHVLCVCMFS